MKLPFPITSNRTQQTMRRKKHGEKNIQMKVTPFQKGKGRKIEIALPL
jgi:hypothetical protein